LIYISGWELSQEFSTACAFSAGVSFDEEEWNLRRAELAAEFKVNREHGEEANKLLNDLLSEEEKEEKKKWIVYEVPQLTEEEQSEADLLEAEAWMEEEDQAIWMMNNTLF
jgi:dephospho-CoA kinase